MNITHNDEHIGTHSISFVREGERLHVDTKVEVAVKMAFVTVYRMLKTSRETWERDRVVAYARALGRGPLEAFALAERALVRAVSDAGRAGPRGASGDSQDCLAEILIQAYAGESG